MQLTDSFANLFHENYFRSPICIYWIYSQIYDGKTSNKFSSVTWNGVKYNIVKKLKIKTGCTAHYYVNNKRNHIIKTCIIIMTFRLNAEMIRNMGGQCLSRSYSYGTLPLARLKKRMKWNRVACQLSPSCWLRVDSEDTRYSTKTWIKM